MSNAVKDQTENAAATDRGKCPDCLAINFVCICKPRTGSVGPDDALPLATFQRGRRPECASDSTSEPPPSANRLEIASLRGALDGAMASRDRAWARVKKLENRLRVIREALDGEFDG